MFTRVFEIFLVSLRLGLTSFGGPVAHLGYFHNEYVNRRKWLDDKAYADLVALSQFIPGPASSQVGIGIGLMRGGLPGAFASFAGFTFPSVAILIGFAALLEIYDLTHAGWIYGLKIVAVAVVAHAVLGMGKKLAPDRERATIALVTLMLVLLWQTVYSQVALIVLAGIAGYIIYKGREAERAPDILTGLSYRFAAVCLGLFFALLALLPLARQLFEAQWLALFDSFYRAGALVFGGGHVVLPLLEREVVPAGLMGADEFLAGYGAAQAVPGPLFTFASYLGTVAGGISGGLIATAAIFLPAFLLILGTLPFWGQIRKNPVIQSALYGVNAAVVGILAAALYNPIFTSAVDTAIDFAFAAGLFGLLVYWKMPAWFVVLVGIIGGAVISWLFYGEILFGL
ncbi:chromate efflux transporter [Alteribacter natronophilus]|uniref:chromate efflux transporter n=1 Tax=Alteribacter natronophilus TaxID=2583810 RepID=UPI00110F63FA|nr:chromate efflux transporter [Alteribacter natronophilus]TMW70315.1 chromate efflux transporter [Alteribacter natronophilus]